MSDSEHEYVLDRAWCGCGLSQYHTSAMCFKCFIGNNTEKSAPLQSVKGINKIIKESATIVSGEVQGARMH
jgi:hypothetical protein